MSTLIMESLKALYFNKPDVLCLLQQLDLSHLEDEFYKHLFSRIDRESFERVDEYLRGEECRQYNEAIAYASYAIIDSLDGIVKLIDLEKEEVQ